MGEDVHTSFYFAVLCHKCTLLSEVAIQVSSVAQSCLTHCDPIGCNMPGLTVHHQLPELFQTHVH